MTYFKVTYDYIFYLKSNLKSFINDVLYEINKQERDEIADAQNEAADDKYYERYDPDSVDKWLSERVSYLKNWAENLRSELDSDYHRALNLIEEASNTRFYESDMGYEFEINLYEGKIFKSKIPYEDDCVNVVFTGISWDVDGTCFEFEPDTPSFTDWLED